MARPSTTNRWKLGLFVTLGFAATIAVLGWLGASRLRRETIEVNYFFDEQVSGLDIGAPVKFRGVPIGKVVRIRTGPDQRHVRVVAKVYVDALRDLGLRWKEVPGKKPFVSTNLRAQLITSILTGQTYIESDFFDPERYPIPDYGFEVPWNTIHSVPSAYKTIESGLLEALDKLPDVEQEMSGFLTEARTTLAAMRLPELTEQARRTLAAAEDRLVGLEELKVLQSGTSAFDETQRAMSEVRGLAADLRSSEGALTRALVRYEELGRVLEEAFGHSSLAETVLAIGEFGSEGAEAAGALARLSRDLRVELESARRTLEAIRRLAALLERDPAVLLRGRAGAPAPFLENR